MEQDVDSASHAVANKARCLHERIKPLLEMSAAAKSSYAFKNRLKTAGDITAKVHAKRNHPDPKQRKSAYAPSDVTDASGFRIVCLFNREIPTALEQVVDLIAALKAKGDPTFGNRPIVEVIYFSSRSRTEPLSIFPDVKRVIDEKDLQSVFKTPEVAEGERASSYSSVHVIVEGWIEENQGARPFTARSEIQIRSVFEEAWGEINHRLKYAPEKRQRALGGAAIAERSEDRHLDALKSLTDGCAQYADLIDIALAERRESQARRTPQSVESTDQLRAPFRQCAEDVRVEIDHAYDVEKAAEDLRPDDPKKGERFLTAGTLFSEAITALERSDLPRDPAERTRLVRLLREEVGYCYMFSRNRELVSAAEDIFVDVLRDDPNNAIILVRLAQIKRDSDELEQARELIEKALAAMPPGAAGRHERLAWLAQRDLAFICWRLVDRQRQRPDAIALLERAAVVSEAAVEAAPTENHRLNAGLNLLYYYGDLVERVNSVEKRSSIKERARRLLTEIAPKVDLTTWPTSRLDTIVYAERTFGRTENARLIAAVVKERIESVMRLDASAGAAERLDAFQRLPREDQRMLLYAQDVLAGT